MTTVQGQWNIRRAALADADVIAEYNWLLAQETEGIHLERATLRAGVEAVLGDSTKGVYWLAETAAGTAGGKVVVGQLMITWEWSDWRNGMFWWIQSVYVHRDWRARGVFTALCEFVGNQARQQQGVCGIRLYMEEENHRARRSYQRLGLHETRYRVFETDFRLPR